MIHIRRWFKPIGVLRIQKGLLTFYTTALLADQAKRSYPGVSVIPIPAIPIRDQSRFDAYDVVESKDGDIWFQTSEGAIVRYDTHYGFGETPDGTLWCVSDRLQKLANRKTVDISEPAELAENFCDCIQSTKNGHLWIGSRSYGIFHYDPVIQAWTKYDSETGLENDAVNSILRISDTFIHKHCL